MPGALSLGHKNSESFIWRVGHIYHKNFRPIDLLVKFAFLKLTVYFCLWAARSLNIGRKSYKIKCSRCISAFGLGRKIKLVKVTKKSVVLNTT